MNPALPEDLWAIDIYWVREDIFINGVVTGKLTMLL